MTGSTPESGNVSSASEVEFWEYVARAVDAKRDNPDWRLGQAAFNVLNDVRPDLADQVRGNIVDPFYQDKRLPEFFVFLGERWSA